MTEQSAYFPVAKAISTWLYPHAEVTIQDLESQKVIAVFNDLTGQHLGKPPSQPLAHKADSPYEYVHDDGRVFQCLAVMLDDKEKEMMVMRLEVSQLKKAKAILEAFISKPKPEKVLAFQQDWHEKIRHYVVDFCRQHQLSPERLKKHHKLRIIQILKACGAFKGKGAANAIASVLDISRATVYSYLKMVTMENQYAELGQVH